MADFSFSFDSDNPFAEPEPATAPAPKTANGSNGNGASGNGASGNGASGNGASENGSPEFGETEPVFAPGNSDFDFSMSQGQMEAELPTLIASDSPAPGEAAPAEVDAGGAFDFDFPPPQPQPSASAPLEVAPEEFTSSAPPAAVDLDIDALFAQPEVAEVAPAEPEIIEPEVAEVQPTEVQPAESLGFDFSMGDESVAAVAAAPATDEDGLDDLGETADRPRKPPIPVPRVAILGASGIGKNHARWFHRNGGRIVAFLGTSENSTAATQSALDEEFEFEGQAYTDLARLLEEAQPDIVCVATPPALHFGHVLQSLEAGAHVLCEKPLVYAPTRKFRENRDGAKELVKVAAKKNLVLGTQLQYGAATPILCKLAGLATNEVGDFAMEIETLNFSIARDPRELWIDLGPHPVSIAQVLAGEGAQLAEETIRFEPHQSENKTEVLTRFGINCADGRLLMVRAIVRALNPETTKRKPRRRFSFNGHSIIYAPLAGPKGSFQAQFIAPDGYSSVYADPVDYLIGNFVRACRGAEPLLISGDFGRENLEWMLKIGTPPEA